MPEMRETYGKDKAKQVAFATATMQAHRVKKTPKGYGTPEGRHEARRKHDKPMEEYQKTAMWNAYWDELGKLAQGTALSKPIAAPKASMPIPKAPSMAPIRSGAGMSMPGGPKARVGMSGKMQIAPSSAGALKGMGL